MDREISGGLEDLKVAEGIVGKKWKWEGKKYRNPARHNAVTPYYGEGSTLEDDIKVSQKNEANAEEALGVKMELP